MTIKELDSRFTAAALESAAAADALGLDSRGLRALCEGHGAAAGLKRSLQRGQPTPLFDELTAAGRTARVVSTPTFTSARKVRRNTPQLLRSSPRMQRTAALYSAAVDGPMVTTGRQPISQNTLRNTRSTSFSVLR